MDGLPMGVGGGGGGGVGCGCAAMLVLLLVAMLAGFTVLAIWGFSDFL